MNAPPLVNRAASYTWKNTAYKPALGAAVRFLNRHKLVLRLLGYHARLRLGVTVIKELVWCWTRRNVLKSGWLAFLVISRVYRLVGRNVALDRSLLRLGHVVSVKLPSAIDI